MPASRCALAITSLYYIPSAAAGGEAGIHVPVTLPVSASERRERHRQKIEEHNGKEMDQLRSILELNVSQVCSMAAREHSSTLTFVRCIVGRALYPADPYDELKLSEAAANHLQDMQEESVRTKPPAGLGNRGAMTEEYQRESSSYQAMGGVPRVYISGDWSQACDLQTEAVGYRYSLEHWVKDGLLNPASSNAVVGDVGAADFVYVPFCMTSLLLLASARLELTSSQELQYLHYQGQLLELAIREIENRYLLPGTERAFEGEAFQSCWARENCRFLIVSIHGRHVWQQFAAVFGEKAVFLTHAGLSDWTSRQATAVYWSGLDSTFPMRAKPPLIQANMPLGCRAACLLHCQVEPRAVLPDDIVLPWTVAYAWGPRSSMFHTRDLLAFFAGTVNSCSRTLLSKVFAGKFTAAVRGTSSPRNATLVFPSVVKLEQHTWSELAFRSLLCLVPDGDSPNTGRLIEVIMHGCVPIIITNRLQPPFHEFINWHRIAFFVHEDEIPSLPRILSKIVQDMKTLAEMHYRLEEAALALDYTRGLNTLVFLALRKRALALRSQWVEQRELPDWVQYL